MDVFFNVKIEFNHEKFKQIIEDCIADKKKGYVCVIDGNVLTKANRNQYYKSIVNTSTVNTCDGSSIAWLAGKIYKKSLKALNGPEIFSKYIEEPYSQILLGSTESVVGRIRNKIVLKGVNHSNITHISLPFLDVDRFDYKMIARKINEIEPDIIWVSLGAPKQEVFMSNILPYINSGIMFGIGAAFSFYIGEIPEPKKRKGVLQFIWLKRIFHEPIKQIKRVLPYLAILPKLIYQEKRKANKIN